MKPAEKRRELHLIDDFWKDEYFIAELHRMIHKHLKTTKAIRKMVDGNGSEDKNE